VAHPLLSRLIHQDESRTIFASRLGPDKDWILDEHRLLGRSVLPGTAYLEMARAAFEEITGATAIEMREVVFWSPLVVAGNGQTEVFTVLDRTETGCDFQVITADVGGSGERRFCRHASGTLLPLSSKGDLTAEETLSDIWSVAESEPCTGGGVEAGPRWSTLRRYLSGDGWVVGTLRLDEQFKDDFVIFKLHPALLDVAVGIATGPKTDAFHIPLSYGRLCMWAPLEPEIAVLVRPPNSASAANEILSVDVVIADPAGKVLVEIEQFTKKKVSPGMTRGAETLGTMDMGSAAFVPSHAFLHATKFPEIVQAEERGIRPDEGVEAFRRILAWRREPQIVVSTGGLAHMARPAAAAAEVRSQAEGARRLAGRPELPTDGDRKLAFADGPETLFARIWSEVLGVERIGPHDNFFELGGDSILALQVVAKAREVGLQLDPGQIFELQTIAELSRAVVPVDDGAAHEAAVEKPDPETSAAPPQVAIPGFSLADLDVEKVGRLLRKLDEPDEDTTSQWN
jgi:aryl carrier-like protein